MTNTFVLAQSSNLGIHDKSPPAAPYYSAAMHIPDVFVKPVVYPQASPCSAATRVGERKNRYGKSYFMVPREEISPNSEYVPGIDVGCC